MNIIQDVKQNNNTAQEQLKDILEKSNKISQKLQIREPLHGDLDFSILPEYGFTNITYISLEKGEITSITGLPKLLISLSCADNLLDKIENLPEGLQSLDVAHNFITELDVSYLKQLELLNFTDNKITTIENLPHTLLSINGDNNLLHKLNLFGLAHLELLNISNNPITLIENLPEGIIVFNMENTPDIEFRNSPVIPISAVVEDVDSRINYNESLNEYFRLKRNYNDKLFRMKKKVHEKAKSTRAAQREVLTLKPPCIKCKRPVGTIFSKKDNRYIAICGDVKTPCKLDIQIFAGTISPVNWLLYIIKENMDLTKDAIIRQKLDTIFNYTSEEDSVKLFKQKLKTYNSNSDSFKELSDKNNEALYGSQKKILIDKKNGDIFQLIEQIHILLEEYTKTNNHELLKTAMDMQVLQLLPETRNLRKLKHEVMEMNHEKINEKDMYGLFQYPCTLSKIDDVFGEPPRVIKFTK